MARPKNNASASSEAQEKPAAVGFNPAGLSREEQEAVVEEYLGVHPRYFLYKGLNIQLNHGKFRAEGHHFNGWKPKDWKYNSFKPGR